MVPSSQEIRSKLNQIALKRRSSQAQVALNWCRSHGAMPIPGIRHPLQAKDALNALKWNLSDEEKEELDYLSLNCKNKMPQNPFNSE